MNIRPGSGVYAMSVAGRHLARLYIDLRKSGDAARDMRDLAQQLRTLADNIDQEADL